MKTKQEIQIEETKEEIERVKNLQKESKNAFDFNTRKEYLFGLERKMEGLIQGYENAKKEPSQNVNKGAID